MRRCGINIGSRQKYKQYLIMKTKIVKVYVYKDTTQSDINTILDYLLGVYKDIRIYIRNYNSLNRPIEVQFNSLCDKDDCRYICSCMSSDETFKHDVFADFDGNEDSFAGMSSIDFDCDPDWILDYKYNPNILCYDFKTESSVVYFKENTVWNKIEAPKDSI